MKEGRFVPEIFDFVQICFEGIAPTHKPTSMRVKYERYSRLQILLFLWNFLCMK